MKPTTINKEKMCRKFGQKMMLTPERCASPKCAFTRRSYAPGAHGQSRRRRPRSGYGEQLLEKQRIRILYGVSERSLRRTVREALARTRAAAASQNALDVLTSELERRLDNVLFRMGIAPSRAIARQLVSHGHILVNGRRTTVPSRSLKVGETVSVRPQSALRVPFAERREVLKKYKPPAWLTLDSETLGGKMVALPTREEIAHTADVAKVVEFYAR